MSTDSNPPRNPINPYSPSVELDDAEPQPMRYPQLNVTRAILLTIIGVAFSGGLFGMAFGLLAVFSSGPSIVIVGLIGFAFVFGSLYAGAISIPVVLIGFALLFAIRSAKQLGPWGPVEVKRFATISGAMSGFSSLAISGEPSAIALALIPAAVGAVFTLVVVRFGMGFDSFKLVRDPPAAPLPEATPTT